MWIGSADEGPAEEGIAHVVEHMAFKTAGRLCEGDVSVISKLVGSRFNAFTSFDRIAFIVESDVSDADVMFEMLTDLAFKATFVQAQLESELAVVMDEMIRRTNTADYALWSARRQWATPHAFPKHDPIGIAQTLATLTAPALQRFYDRHFVPANATYMCSTSDARLRDGLHARAVRFGIKNARLRPRPPMREWGRRIQSSFRTTLEHPMIPSDAASVSQVTWQWNAAAAINAPRPQAAFTARCSASLVSRALGSVLAPRGIQCEVSVDYVRFPLATVVLEVLSRNVRAALEAMHALTAGDIDAILPAWHADFGLMRWRNACDRFELLETDMAYAEPDTPRLSMHDDVRFDGAAASATLRDCALEILGVMQAQFRGTFTLAPVQPSNTKIFEGAQARFDAIRRSMARNAKGRAAGAAAATARCSLLKMVRPHVLDISTDKLLRVNNTRPVLLAPTLLCENVVGMHVLRSALGTVLATEATAWSLQGLRFVVSPTHLIPYVAPSATAPGVAAAPLSSLDEVARRVAEVDLAPWMERNLDAVFNAFVANAAVMAELVAVMAVSGERIPEHVLSLPGFRDAALKVQARAALVGEGSARREPLAWMAATSGRQVRLEKSLSEGSGQCVLHIKLRAREPHARIDSELDLARWMAWQEWACVGFGSTLMALREKTGAFYGASGSAVSWVCPPPRGSAAIVSLSTSCASQAADGCLAAILAAMASPAPMTPEIAVSRASLRRRLTETLSCPIDRYGFAAGVESAGWDLRRLVDLINSPDIDAEFRPALDTDNAVVAKIAG